MKLLCTPTYLVFFLILCLIGYDRFDLGVLYCYSIGHDIYDIEQHFLKHRIILSRYFSLRSNRLVLFSSFSQVKLQIS